MLKNLKFKKKSGNTKLKRIKVTELLKKKGRDMSPWTNDVCC